MPCKKKRHKYNTREEIVRSHLRNLDKINKLYLDFKIGKREYVRRRLKLNKIFAKRMRRLKRGT